MISKRDKGTIKYRRTPDGRTVFTFKKKMRSYDKLIFMYLLRSLEGQYSGQVDSFMNEDGHLIIRHTPGMRKSPKVRALKSPIELDNFFGGIERELFKVPAAISHRGRVPRAQDRANSK